MLFFIQSSLCVDAQELLQGTRLVGVRVGEGHSQLVRTTSRGGYELEGGEYQSFSQWYGFEIQDIEVEALTYMADGFWLSWGISTGQSGPKYRIDPSIIVGFEDSIDLQNGWSLWIWAKGKIGGYLWEESCVADYSLSSAEDTVNCRLAASTITPEQTLEYLWAEPPPNQFNVGLQLTWLF